MQDRANPKDAVIQCACKRIYRFGQWYALHELPRGEELARSLQDKSIAALPGACPQCAASAGNRLLPVADKNEQQLKVLATS